MGFVLPKGSSSAREGVKLYSKEGRELGYVTSGTWSPVLKHPLGMCYLKVPFNKVGTEVEARIRNKKLVATVTKMPLVPHNYYK